MPKPVVAALNRPAADRKRTEIETLRKQFADAAPDDGYAAALGRLGERIAAREKIDKSIPRVMVMQDQPARRDTFILDKGLYNKPLAKVPATTPAVLPPLRSGMEPDRLALAEWLVAPGHPLTSRVTVNRLWQRFFGVGLVKTPGDFGVQGERPSHPDLLDWLAVEFVENGWSVKHLVRTIVISHTYRQASAIPPGMAERDPENRVLARGPRFRLPAWMIRDQALAASGLLVRAVGGRPVHPYQPAGVWEDATFGKKSYPQGHGGDLYRRSVYTFWRRIIGPTGFFDTATRQTCTVGVGRTNTPLHALTTLNDVTYVEAARALAEIALQADDPDDAARLDRIYRRVLARRPTADERKVLLAGLARLCEQYTSDPAAAKALLAVGESARDEALGPAEHAAWTALGLTILNLDETLTKE